jgi:excisionase family DNA binding protein
MPEPVRGDGYLTLEELAGYSRISVRQLRKYLALPPAQALPCYRPGRKVLVRRSDFDVWFAQYRTRGKPTLTANLAALGFDPAKLPETRTGPAREDRRHTGRS